MRACEPDIEGFLDHDGVKVGYSVYGTGERTILLAPAWLPVDSRLWKAQVHYLARHFRVITVDPRGNGRSDRPTDPAAYSDLALATDLVAALDAVGVRQAVLVGFSVGGWTGTIAASRFPDRFLGFVAIAPNIPHLTRPSPEQAVYDFDARRDSYTGWEKYNQHHWRADYPDFLDWFFTTLFSEPHSSKQIEDCIGWGLGTTPEVLVASVQAPSVAHGRAEVEAVIGQLRLPVLVIHGDDDRCIPFSRGERFAELTGGQLIRIEGGGHVPLARQPVPVNRWIHDFAAAQFAAAQSTARFAAGPAVSASEPGSGPGDRGAAGPEALTVQRVQPPERRWRRALDRPRRVLYLSSPIGLGHARRDLAIVEQLRLRYPDVQVDWLAQHPVTALLAPRGERVHPASALLASESAHVEGEAGEHDLHAFQAIRRMDEILVANFMIFDDLVRENSYDLWVGDESWDLDYFLHENPELKNTSYAWLTDFVGWLPMPSGGAAEAALTADYNAEMIEQIGRFPRLRDRSLFVGDAEDVVPDSFGPGLPAIPEWTGEHYTFTGYVTGFDPAEIVDRQGIRESMGWRADERVCVVTVGGTGVGLHLVRRALAAYPLAAQRVPGLRLVVVTGPRLDPAGLDVPAGVELHRYLPDLHRCLAACDLAVVQGGLTTTMELTAAGTPFLYVPLANHFEQQYHVPYRLARYGAGRRLEYADTHPEGLAGAIAEEIGRPVRYRPVAPDGAARAGEALAELL